MLERESPAPRASGNRAGLIRADTLSHTRRTNKLQERRDLRLAARQRPVERRQGRAMTAKWEWGFFRIATKAGDRGDRVGWFWRHWGVSGGKGVWCVFHCPSGGYVTSFEGPGLQARKLANTFCEEVDHVADWSTPTTDPTIGLQMHRIALRLTGGRPYLRLLQGGGP